MNTKQVSDAKRFLAALEQCADDPANDMPDQLREDIHTLHNYLHEPESRFDKQPDEKIPPLVTFTHKELMQPLAAERLLAALEQCADDPANDIPDQLREDIHTLHNYLRELESRFDKQLDEKLAAERKATEELKSRFDKQPDEKIPPLITFTHKQMMQPFAAERKATEETVQEWIKEYTNTEKLTSKQLDYINVWVYRWMFSFFDILDVISICVKRYGEIKFNYVNELLEAESKKKLK